MAETANLSALNSLAAAQRLATDWQLKNDALRAENERLKAAHGHLWFAITNIVNDFDEALTATEVIDELRDLLTEHTNRRSPAPSGPDHE